MRAAADAVLRLGVSMLALGAAPALAQQTDAADPDVILVTAQKRTQDVLEIGGTVRVVGQAQLEARRVTEVRDLAALIPNLDVKEQVPGAMPVVTIRGVGLDDFSSANNPSAGIYIDEVYVASLAQMSFDFFDLERIEVLKGPQGTLYGRNSTAGAINIVTAKPKLGEFGARVAGGLGNWQSYDLEGMVNVPLGETAALRIAAKTIQQDKGFFRNRVNGENYGDRNLFLGRAQLHFEPTDALTIDAKIEGQRSRSGMGQPEFWGAIPSPANPGATCPGDRSCVDFFGYNDTDGDPFTGDWSVDNRYTIDQVSASLRVAYDFGGVTLTSVTGWQDFDREFLIDTDASPRRITDFGQEDHVRQWSQELRLSGETAGINWIVGGFYSYDHVETANPGFLQDLFNTTTLSQLEQDTRSAALFGNAEWPIAERLTLVTGVRYTWEEKEAVGGTVDFVSQPPASFLSLAPFGTGPVQISSVDDRISDRNWSWKVGLNWEVADSTLLYVSASQGVKSGGFFSGVTVNSAQLQPYLPERLIALEAGAKGRASDIGLTYDAAIFYYDYKDVQTFIRDTSGGLPIQRLGNVDSAEIYGLDADIQYRPVGLEALTLQAGLGLLHTRLSSFASSGGVVPAGNRLPNAPKVTFNGSAAYTIGLGDDLGLTLLGAVRQSGDAFKDALNDPLIAQGSFWMFDARATLASSPGGWEVALWGRNLSDTRYVVQGNNSQSLGYVYRFYNAPRTWGVSFAKRF
jgi:iron complex outermembrane receptor protein